MNGRLLSLNVGRPREVAWEGKTVRTSIWKTAVDEPRIHHQWMPDTLSIEREMEETRPALEALGHSVRVGASQGDAQSILIKDGKKYPGVDHRTRGAAAGY